MPSNGLIAIPGGSALLQVHALQDSVLTVPLLDSKHDLLELSLSGIGGTICLLLICFGGVISERIQLFRLLLLRGAGLVQQLVTANAQVEYQLVSIHDPVMKDCYSPKQIVGRRSV